MLSLVAYQSSDESGSDAEETAGEITSESKPCDTDGSQLKNSSSASSFELPAPSKSKGAVKITVPSLKEFEDEEKEEPSSKKFKKSSGTSLIGLLPPPKYSKLSTQKSFMPYVLTKKQVPSNNIVASSAHGSSTAKPPKKSTSSSKPVPKEESHLEKESVVTEEDDHSPVRSFFSFEESQPLNPDPNFYAPMNNEALKPQEKKCGMNRDVLQASNLSETSFVSTKKNSEPLWQNEAETTFVKHSESTSTSKTYLSDQPLETQSPSNTFVEYPEVVPNNTDYAVDDRFLRLQGKRKGQEEINIIDVSVDDELSDKTEWLTKSLTEEKVHRPSRKKHDMPTQLQKRKHQITYLAFQAKEREFELKNQWAQNRLTKRETQAKYGF